MQLKISNLNKELSFKSNEYIELLEDYDSYNSQYDNTIADYEDTLSNYEDTITEYENNISNYQMEINSLKKQIMILNISDNKLSVQELYKYFKYSNNDIIDEFGNGKLVRESSWDFQGYEYEELGLTFFFNNENMVAFIKLGVQIDIRGMSTGMNLNEIKNKLELITNESYDILTYQHSQSGKTVESITYHFDGFFVIFQSFPNVGPSQATLCRLPD